MAGLFDPIDYQGTTYTPYEPNLAGLLASKWDSLFMPKEAIEMQNEAYYGARRGLQADEILSKPAIAGGTQIIDNLSGSPLDMTPEQVAAALPLMPKYQAENPKAPYYDQYKAGQLVGKTAYQQPQQYSQQQLAQLGAIKGYNEVARAMMASQERELAAIRDQTWSVNYASKASEENNIRTVQQDWIMSPKNPNNIQSLAAAAASKAQAAAATSNAQVNRMTAGLPTAPVGMRYAFDKDGVPTLKTVDLPSGTVLPQKPANDMQIKAQANLQSMLPALEVINEGKGNLGTIENYLSKAPFIGDTMARWSQTPEEGRQRAAEGIFAAQYIQSISGASATENEVKRLSDSIFARPGDSKEALLQKQNNRQAIRNGTFTLAGMTPQTQNVIKLK